jgi:uncharacterized protein YbjT (DUF2867 family)
MNAPQPSRPLVLVAGATGYLGKHVVESLHRGGWPVRALARKAERLGAVREMCQDVFVGEATRPETLEGLCEGVHTVVSSLGIRAFTGKVTCWDVDWKGNMAVLEQAKQAGVQRFVFVSVLGGETYRSRVPQVEARERVADALQQTDMEWTVVRPTGFFNDMSEFFGMAQKGTAWSFGAGTLRLNPIHGADLADYIVATLDKPEAVGAFLPVGGPEILSMDDLLEIAFKVAGKPMKVRRISPKVLQVLGALSAPFSTNFSNMMKFFGSMVESDGVGEVTGTHRLEAFFEHLARGGDAVDLRCDRA